MHHSYMKPMTYVFLPNVIIKSGKLCHTVPSELMQLAVYQCIKGEWAGVR